MEDDQQFCLRWNNHQSTLISVFDNLLASETLVDCTLAAEGKHLKAHKVVLSACSPYFASLLKEQYDKHPIFILKDVKYQELRYMMDYMYRGEVNISQDQLAALLKAAESLQIKGLSDNRPSVPKPEQQQQQQQQHQHQHQHAHHRATLPTNVGSVSGVVPKYPGSNYTLEQTKRTRLSGRTMGSIDTSEMDSREGSSSPSRKHRKMRRKSNENAMNDTHDNSNSSQLLQSNQQQQQQQHLQQQQQQIVNANVVAGLSGVGAITAAASALAASSAAGAVLHSGPSLAAAAAAAAAASSVVPTSSGAGGGGSSIKKTDSLKATSQTDAMNIIENQTAGGSNMSIIASGSVTDAVSDHHHHHQTLHHHQYQAHHTDTTTGTDNKMTHKQKLQQQQQQQPSSKDIISANQSELVIEPKSEYDDEANDEAVEDLTLDEEDMGMDDLDQKAGPSQGGEGSSQGYAPWQHDQSQDELLLNAQEAQQRDPQDNQWTLSVKSVTSLNKIALEEIKETLKKRNHKNAAAQKYDHFQSMDVARFEMDLLDKEWQMEMDMEMENKRVVNEQNYKEQEKSMCRSNSVQLVVLAAEPLQMKSIATLNVQPTPLLMPPSSSSPSTPTTTIKSSSPPSPSLPLPPPPLQPLSSSLSSPSILRTPSKSSTCTLSTSLDRFSFSSYAHVCPRCDKMYTYKKNLSRHLRFECGIQPTEKCSYCPYLTRYKHSLNTHIRTQHPEHFRPKLLRNFNKI